MTKRRYYECNGKAIQKTKPRAKDYIQMTTSAFALIHITVEHFAEHGISKHIMNYSLLRNQEGLTYVTDFIFRTPIAII